VARLEYRWTLIMQSVEDAGYKVNELAAFAGRGGLLPPMTCGTYLVDDAMVEELRQARRGEHASNLGALLALKFAQAAGVNAYMAGVRAAFRNAADRALGYWACAEYQGGGAAVCTGTGANVRGAPAGCCAYGQWNYSLGSPRWTHDRQQHT